MFKAQYHMEKHLALFFDRVGDRKKFIDNIAMLETWGVVVV